MTLDELKAWQRKNGPYVDTTREQIDGCGNEDFSQIYKVGDEYYAVDYCNGHPTEHYGEKGYVRGVYLPYLVRPVQRSYTDYEAIEPNEN